MPPTVTGLDDDPMGAVGSFGAPGVAGIMPGSLGTAPVGIPALGSLAGGGGGAMDGSVGGVMASPGAWLAGICCAMAALLIEAMPIRAAPASMMDFMG